MRKSGKTLVLSASLLAGVALLALSPSLRASLGHAPGALARMIVTPAHALAGTAKADDISIETDTATYTIKHVEATGTTLSDDELEALFDDESKVSLADRMAKLTAATVSIPEIAGEVEAGDGKIAVTYTDVKFANVAKGVAGAVSIGEIKFAATGDKNADLSGVIVNFAARNVDTGAILHAHHDARKDADEPMKLQYESIAADGMTIRGVPGVAFSIGKISIKDVSGRALKVPLSEMAGHVAAAAAEDAEPARKQELAALYADFMRSSAFGSFEVRDIAVAVDIDGKPGKVKLARLAANNFSGGKLGEFVYEGFDLDVPEAKMKLGSFGFRGFDLRPMLALADFIAAKGPDALGEMEDPRPFIPTIDHVGMTALDVDAKATDGQKGNAEGGARNKFTMANFSLDSGGFIGGIPTSATLALDHVAVDLSGLADDPAMKDFAALGYSKVDISAKLDLGWNEAANELAVKNLSFQSAGMGAASGSLVLGNVTRDLFAANPALMQAAALGAVLKKVEIGISNEGILEKALAMQAAKDGKPVDEVRKMLILGASVGLPSILGDSPAARTIANAVSKYLADPKTLKLTATSANGLGVGDLGLIGNPVDLLGKIDVKASVNE